MPLPTASRTYESPDLGALPPGPYAETPEEISVAPGGSADVGSPGAAVLLVLDGRVDVQPLGGSVIQVSAREATLLEPGATVSATNSMDRPARLLRFVLEPATAGG